MAEHVPVPEMTKTVAIRLNIVRGGKDDYWVLEIRDAVGGLGGKTLGRYKFAPDQLSELLSQSAAIAEQETT